MTSTKASSDAVQVVVADIGGTNARFALATLSAAPTGRSTARVELAHSRQFSCADADGVAPLLAGYCQALPGPSPAFACIASAGPGDGSRRHLTNLGWTVDAAELAAVAGLAQVLLVNDFEALARAAVECSTLPVASGQAFTDAPRCVIGPGTGLGVAVVIPGEGGPRCIATEAAHMRFAAGDAEEWALVRALSQHHDPVYNELLLSGPGLERLHALLHPGAPGRNAASISDAALAGAVDALETVHRFLGMLGSVAGDIVLAQGARGGVVLGGGILPRWASLLADSPLVPRFRAKGAMSRYLADVPIALINETRVAEKGAALLFAERALS